MYTKPTRWRPNTFLNIEGRQIHLQSKTTIILYLGFPIKPCDRPLNYNRFYSQLKSPLTSSATTHLDELNLDDTQTNKSDNSWNNLRNSFSKQKRCYPTWWKMRGLTYMLGETQEPLGPVNTQRSGIATPTGQVWKLSKNKCLPHILWKLSRMIIWFIEDIYILQNAYTLPDIEIVSKLPNLLKAIAYTW